MAAPNAGIGVYQLAATLDAGRNTAHIIRTMPLIIFILIVILIAQIGFWDALGAILGAVLMVVLLVGLLAAIAVFGVLFLLNRLAR